MHHPGDVRRVACWEFTIDSKRFDTLSRALATAGTRRGLLGLLAGWPLARLITLLPEALAQAAGRRHRRKKHHKHHHGDNQDNRKGHRKDQDKGRHKDKARDQPASPPVSPAPPPPPSPPGCVPEPTTVTCADRCSSVVNNCGEAVACGTCACASGCPPCQACNTATGLCDPVADGTACDDGDACTQTDTCQGGVCEGSNPVMCPPAPNECDDPGTCDPATGQCASPTSKPNRTPCSDGNICCNGTCCAGCCGTDGSCGACRVFATSRTYTGRLGGLDGADAKCQGRAQAASLPGTYKAWLSDATGSPSTRFRCTAASCSERGYTLVDGTTVVATDWVDLTTCSGNSCLDHAIDRDESGNLPGSPSNTWTGTTTAGTLQDDTLDCREWSSDGYDSDGVNGSLVWSSSGWTSFITLPCGYPNVHLYCFQQE